MNIKYTWHILKTKGFLGFFFRLKYILYRFGLTSSKSKRSLNIFLNIINEFGYTPTLCITAMLLKNNQEIINKLIKKKIEIALHGYSHTNYTSLNPTKISDHIKKSKKLFKRHKIQISGFRFPYLCCNENILNIFKKNNFLWSSNQVIYWDVLNINNFTKFQWKNLEKVLINLYNPKSATHYLSLPQKKDGFIEIPVSIPDDEIIIDRLGIKNQEKIAEIWWKIFEETHKRGELFTLQLHHERVSLYKNALEFFLNKVNSLKPKVWVASLREIAEWWKEKYEFNFQIISQKNNYYYIKAVCSDRATILIKKSNTKDPSNPLFNNYHIINKKYFKIKSNKKLSIGLTENSSPRLSDFLRQEGFITKLNSHKNNCSLYLKNYQTFNLDHEKDLSNTLETTSSNFIRFWRWPNNAQSALAITLDIDGITIFDFLKRYLYF